MRVLGIDREEPKYRANNPNGISKYQSNGEIGIILTFILVIEEIIKMPDCVVE